MSGNGLPMGKANLQTFANTIEELADLDSKLLVVTSDSRSSGNLNSFAAHKPEQIIEVGIAEQNLVGVAAGLSASGRTVFAVSPASFLAARAVEQIKHDICYSNRPVTLVGISAGVSYGALGSTHHSLHDFAVLRAIHNLTIVAPADNWETREAVKAAAASRTPVYLRFGKQPLPDLPHENSYTFGKGRLIRDGRDAAIVATGEAVWRAAAAAEFLAKRGISAAVLSMHTVKPLDIALLLEVAGRVRALVVAEEHSVHGGIGEACSRVLLENGVTPKYRVAAIPDEYTVTGSQDQILAHYGISETGLAKTVTSLLEE